MSGRFIAIEGGEGTGKTTLLKGLIPWVKETQGVEVVVTREPGGTPAGERMRSILLDPETDLCGDAELLLVSAARCQHVHQVIQPALDRGDWVICDRFIDSTFAYQVGGRRTSVDNFRAASAMAVQGVFPHLTLLLLMDPVKAMARIERGLDRMEQEDRAFFDRVAYNFENLHRSPLFRGRSVDQINADQPPEDILAAAQSAIQKHPQLGARQ